MNAALSTTAWVLHDLGLATSVGGSLFGKTSLHPAIRAIPSKDDQGRVTVDAWKDFTPINLASHATVALTWLAGRTILTGRSIDATSRGLVYAKDALVATYLAAGVGSIATGYALSKARESEAKATPALQAVEQALAQEGPSRADRLRRASDLLGTLNLVAGAGIIGLTAVLSMRSGRSSKWALVSRFLP